MGPDPGICYATQDQETLSVVHKFKGTKAKGSFRWNTSVQNSSDIRINVSENGNLEFCLVN